MFLILQNSVVVEIERTFEIMRVVGWHRKKASSMKVAKIEALKGD